MVYLFLVDYISSGRPDAKCLKNGTPAEFTPLDGIFTVSKMNSALDGTHNPSPTQFPVWVRSIPFSGSTPNLDGLFVNLTLLGPQSRFGDKLLIIRVFCPHIRECGSERVKDSFVLIRLSKRRLYSITTKKRVHEQTLSRIIHMNSRM